MGDKSYRGISYVDLSATIFHGVGPNFTKLPSVSSHFRDIKGASHKSGIRTTNIVRALFHQFNRPYVSFQLSWVSNSCFNWRLRWNLYRNRLRDWNRGYNGRWFIFVAGR